MIKSMSIKSKLITGLVCIIALAVTMTYISVCVIGSYVSTDSIIVQGTMVDDYSIRMKGTMVPWSASGFSGYKLNYHDKAIYVKLRYSLVSRFNQSAEFSIDKGGNFEGVQKVYLQGPEENDLKLIWSK